MKDDKLYLVHILECIKRIERYTAQGEREFFEDTKTQDSVLRNLQTLAESVGRISEPRKAARPDVDWRSISGFRNVLVHDYLGVDLAPVWDIVRHDLPDLKTKVESMLSELDTNA